MFGKHSSFSFEIFFIWPCCLSFSSLIAITDRSSGHTYFYHGCPSTDGSSVFSGSVSSTLLDVASLYAVFDVDAIDDDPADTSPVVVAGDVATAASVKADVPEDVTYEDPC
ncbi:hypothetical protein GUJ93_ZPchr0008g13355 [Zizania palustris]|uniref:Uncharacterized protein n=1 Tax=Zizania palustris TaxID=103762 RepID=A0A8J5V4X6_ZIZPA|nr:hypothetical protein GUJ93_ZPchr0008g13355 [Zizania palustris]